MTRAAAILLLATAAAAVADDKKPASELEGEWGATAIVKNGEPDDEDVTERKITFAGAKVTIDLQGRPEPGAFTTDPKSKPAAIDVRPLDPKGNPVKVGDRELVVKGIYKLEKGVLTLCFALEGGERPKEFKAAKGNLLVTLAATKK